MRHAAPAIFFFEGACWLRPLIVLDVRGDFFFPAQVLGDLSSAHVQLLHDLSHELAGLSFRAD
jgi:hypothetical protein